MWILIIIVVILLLGLLLRSNTGSTENDYSQTKVLTVSDIRAYFPYMEHNLAMQYKDAIMKGKYTFKVGKGLIEQWDRKRILKENAASSTQRSTISNSEYTKVTWWQLQQYQPVMNSDVSANYLVEHLLDESKWFTVRKSQLKKWEEDLAKYKEDENKLKQTADNNNKGIAYEKEGDIASAIRVYEKNLEIGYPATHSYSRLMIIYHKDKRFDDEIRVIQKAIEVFSSDERYSKYIIKWQDRLNKLIK